MSAARVGFARRLLQWTHSQLVFVDESVINLAMTPTRARAPPGERVVDRVARRKLGHVLGDRGIAQLWSRPAHDAARRDEQ